MKKQFVCMLILLIGFALHGVAGSYNLPPPYQSGYSVDQQQPDLAAFINFTVEQPIATEAWTLNILQVRSVSTGPAELYSLPEPPDLYAEVISNNSTHKNILNRLCPILNIDAHARSLVINGSMVIKSTEPANQDAYNLNCVNQC